MREKTEDFILVLQDSFCATCIRSLTHWNYFSAVCPSVCPFQFLSMSALADDIHVPWSTLAVVSYVYCPPKVPSHIAICIVIFLYLLAKMISLCCRCYLNTI